MVSNDDLAHAQLVQLRQLHSSRSQLTGGKLSKVSFNERTQVEQSIGIKQDFFGPKRDISVTLIDLDLNQFAPENEQIGRAHV